MGIEVKNVRSGARGEYIGRRGYGREGSPLGNPFVIGRDGTREQVIAKYGRSEYDVWIPEYPTEVPLSAADLTYAFNRWNQDIAGQHNYTG